MKWQQVSCVQINMDWSPSRVFFHEKMSFVRETPGVRCFRSSPSTFELTSNHTGILHACLAGILIKLRSNHVRHFNNDFFFNFLFPFLDSLSFLIWSFLDLRHRSLTKSWSWIIPTKIVWSNQSSKPSHPNSDGVHVTDELTNLSVQFSVVSRIGCLLFFACVSNQITILQL